jgi:phosphoglycolate phosphatase
MPQEKRTPTEPRSGYRLAVFDFDGTLADSMPWFVSVLDEVADRFGFAKLDREELHSLRGLDSLAILKRLELPLWKVPRVAAHMRTLASRERMPLFDGVEATLLELRARGVELAVVSSNGAETIRRSLGDEVAVSIGWYECGASIFGKPTKLKKVLAKSGTAPSDAIYIGDELRDADAAASTGMPFGAVSWGYNDLDVLLAKSPAEVFGSVDELATKIAPR